MSRIKLFCHLTPKDALARGVVEAGDLDRTLTPEEIVALEKLGLIDFASRYTGLTFGTVNARLPVAGPGWDDVLAALERERHDLESQRVRQASASRGIALLLERRGTPDQMARWGAGVLPEEELLTLAREVAFMTFAPFRRYFRLDDKDVKHKPTCNATEVTFDVIERPPLDRFLFARMGDFNRAVTRAPIAWHELGLDSQFSAPLINHRRHLAECLSCGKQVTRMSVLVKVPWLGRDLSREFALEVTP